MVALWECEREKYLKEMSSYEERIRYLYSKMCCAGEWRKLTCVDWGGEELVCSVVFSAW